MRRSWAAVTVGALVAVVVVAAYLIITTTREGTGKGYLVFALFHDASGIYEKSRVQTAGVSIGEIVSRDLDEKTNLAKVKVRIRPEIKVYENAMVTRKSASLLGEYYLEIDPGTPFGADAKGGRVTYRLLSDLPEDQRQLKNVFEPGGIQSVMQQIDSTIPLLRDILKDVQKLTSGPVSDIAHNVSDLIEANSKVLESLLKRVDNIAAHVESITSSEADDVKVALRNAREITESIKGLVGSSQGEVTQTGSAVRESLKKLEGTVDRLDKTMANIEKVSGKVADGEGTVGRLVTDDTLVRNVEDITEDAGTFIKSITKLQTIVGLRTEYNFLAGTFKNYVSVQLMPRPDKFYLFEIVDDPRGFRDETTTVTESSERGTVSEKTVAISEKLRFSLQFGKRVGNLVGRFGIKESTGGIGGDLMLIDDRLVLSADVFDTHSNVYPRAQARASYALWNRNLYVILGADDVFNRNRARAGGGGGFDWFSGLSLTFNDQDLKSLLLFGSGAVSSASGK